MKTILDEKNPRQLSGKTALVTGGARRIGKELVKKLSEFGCNVIVHYNRSSKDADELVKKILRNGGNAKKVQADLSETEEVKRLISRVTANAEKLDILINNASIFPESKLTDVTLQEIQSVLHINSFAPLILAQAFAKQASEGVVINMLDTVISAYARKHAAYQISKNMLADLTDMLAIEFAPKIRVNAVAPGVILPPEGEDDSYLATAKKRNLLNSIGTTDQVAESVMFLILNDFITGQVIYVDGGASLKGKKI